MNTIHNHSDDDSASQSGSHSSTLSSARAVVQCPVCLKELQKRYLFNHIHSYHPSEFVDYVSTALPATLQGYIDIKSPISLDYIIKNDFDEEEIKQVWGCLNCHATFTSQAGGFKHCQNKKCCAKHATQIRKLIKSLDKQKEEAKKASVKQKSRYNEQDRLRDIEYSRLRELYFKRMVNAILEYLETKGEDKNEVLRRAEERSGAKKYLPSYYESLLSEMRGGALFWYASHDDRYKIREFTVNPDGNLTVGKGIIGLNEHDYYVYTLKRLPDEYIVP